MQAGKWAEELYHYIYKHSINLPVHIYSSLASPCLCFWNVHIMKLDWFSWAMLCTPWCHAYPPINISKDIPERHAHLNFPKKSTLSVNVLAKLVPFLEVCGRHDLTIYFPLSLYLRHSAMACSSYCSKGVQ